MLKKAIYLILLFPILGFAHVCQSPWENVPVPLSKVESCRLSVPHGWLVYMMTTEDLDLPNTIFYPDENHEWSF
ncbi:MAG: hypothetical protein QG556_815 [Pseudomonadota bacterium]|nr:hypothetical protein [Pseudomonadota bacterium]